MKPCEQCHHNDWRFKTEGKETVATCQHCNHKIKWERKKKPSSDNKKCITCKSKMERVKKELTAEVLLQPFYHSFVFRCAKCGREISDNTTKRYNSMYT